MRSDSATNGLTEGATEGATGKGASRRRIVVGYVVVVFVAIAVVLLIQASVVKPYRIPSESMVSTLLIGDRVLVDRISWRFSEPRRGEVVVFHAPVPGPVLIKRIVGMPGDTLSLQDGTVYVNGQRLAEPYVRQVGGRPEPTEPFDTGLPWSLRRAFTVPAGSYFLMGDNRIESDDSRDFGPVARRQLVGRAFARYWPPGRVGGLE
jgi:signal peptidase I